MHLVVIHGYILSGTGSNIYSSNIAKEWKKQGHAVTVVCQDPQADKLPFVDEFYVGAENIPSTPPAHGTIRVVVPDIGGLLLTYNYDLYPGYQVKILSECRLDEIDANIKATAEGLKRVVDQGVDLILTNHMLLSPVIASRATEGTNVPYVCKLHGSAMLFSVKPRKAELKPYVIEGLKNSVRIISGTNHVANMAYELLAEEKEELKLEKKMVIVPPGLDPFVFQLGGEVQKHQSNFLENVKEFISRKPNGRKANDLVLPDYLSSSLHDDLGKVADSYDQRSVDADLLERWVPVDEGEPIIIYFGNFLDTKGVGELLTAFPSVLKRVPEARLVLIGFGRYREHLEGMLQSLKDGNFDAFKAYGSAGNYVDFPDDLQSYFRQLTPAEGKRITITGYQEHSQLKEILPLASVSVVGSKATEAFGMVSLEAMAAGVLPLSHNHSGIAEALQIVGEAEPELEKIMRMDVVPGGSRGTADGAYLIQQLPDRIETALRFLYPDGFSNDTKRKEISARLRQVSVSKFSWDGICKDILALRELPKV